jgi:kynurenine formamidase
LQYACQKSRVFYGGLTYEDAKTSHTNGIHNWCQRGGIVGRGILIDMVRYYEKRDGRSPDPWNRHEITVSDLQAALQDQGTRPKQADILMVRSGYVRRHDRASSDERIRGTQNNSQAIGLQASEEMVRWLYEQHFAAHVGDTVAFEAWPPAEGNDWVLHEWSLVWWGTAIGEMWDLERLSEECERHDRWTFLVTSAPLNVHGGVGSPPGAIAIF